MGIRIAPEIKKIIIIKSTELQIHLLQVLLELQGSRSLLVFCGVSHSIPHHCCAKVSDHPCSFFFSKLFFSAVLSRSSLSRHEPWSRYFRAFVINNGEWVYIGEKYLLFVGMPLSICIILSNLIFLPFTLQSHLQSPLNVCLFNLILTWKLLWQVM